MMGSSGFSNIPTENQLLKSNSIFQTIRKFHEMCPEEFSKTGINPCGHCGGTGVIDKHILNFCSNCGGVGYIGFKRLYGQYVCRSCNGSGCQKCNNNGVVDWITHARGGDLYKDKKR